MTICTHSETFRNADDNCTILIECHKEKPYFVPLWSYYYKYDYMTDFVRVSKDLTTKPRKSRLVEMF